MKKRITLIEKNILEIIVREYKPKDKNFAAYWWPAGELEPRLKFLDKLIEKYENNNERGYPNN